MQPEIGLLEKEIPFGNYHFPWYSQENMSHDLADDQCGVLDFWGRLGLPAIRIVYNVYIYIYTCIYVECSV